MLLILLDAAVIVGLVMLLGESDSVGWWNAIGASLAISFGSLFLIKWLAGFGLVMLFVGVALIAVIAAAVMWIVFDIKPARALACGGIFLGYKLLVTIVILAVASAA